jgi:glycosyltransferase involved in cell wall biosynthesis
MKPHSVVCCTPFFGENWSWLADQIDTQLIDWHFFNSRPQNWLEKKIKQPNLAMIRACWQAVQAARRCQADLLISHDPRVSFWCAVFAQMLGLKAEHLAYSFNFPELPQGLKYRWMKWALSRSVNHFIVYSKMEKQLYSDYFEIPIEQFEVVLWSVDTPIAKPDFPLITGDYICAIGGNARDYPTLMSAMTKLPDIPIVMIVRPNNLNNLALSSNVNVQVNLPLVQAMNILKHSRFMVLPLKGSEVPCGHVTLVAAMHLSKAFIITNSVGVSDYVFHEENALTCAPFDPDALAATIRSLWDDPAKCNRLGENGKQFAEKHCSERSSRDQLQRLLDKRGLFASVNIEALRTEVQQRAGK